MKIPLSDDELSVWRSRPETKVIWNCLQEYYNTYQSLRTCEVDDVKYHRGIADVMDDLRKIFIYAEKD